MVSSRRGLSALSPLAVFAASYLLMSLSAGDFYRVPITVAFLFASVYAVAVCGSGPLSERVTAFSRGAGARDMMLMLWIFVLAGAFAQSAKAMGSIDAAVSLALAVLPPQMLLAGLFVATCFVSLSVGTSVGTIVALAPVADGMARASGFDPALVAGVVVGGAFFGDNLSFISDTTVAATTTQGCRMRDKFRANIRIVMPAAVAILLVYAALGLGHTRGVEPGAVDWIKVLPYVAVLVSAVLGLNVMAALCLGLGLTGAIGVWTGAYGLFGWMDAMGAGILGMGELIVISMMAGGLLETVRLAGGLDYIIERLSRRVSGRRGAELSVAALVSLVNVCTANNTVAIITVGPMARRIAAGYGVAPRRVASLLDTFSCATQGLLPYGAQVLMAAGLTGLAPLELIPCLYYPAALGLVAVGAIVVRRGRRQA